MFNMVFWKAFVAIIMAIIIAVVLLTGDLIRLMLALPRLVGTDLRKRRYGTSGRKYAHGSRPVCCTVAGLSPLGFESRKTASGAYINSGLQSSYENRGSFASTLKSGLLWPVKIHVEFRKILP